MAEEAPREVPAGAAILPLIPAELGVHPLLLAVLHAVVFLDGSEDGIVDPAAASEALEYVAAYLQRLSGSELERLREDMECLVAHARRQRWPKQAVDFLKSFVSEFGIGKGDHGRLSGAI